MEQVKQVRAKRLDRKGIKLYLSGGQKTLTYRLGYDKQTPLAIVEEWLISEGLEPLSWAGSPDEPTIHYRPTDSLSTSPCGLG